MMGELLWKHLFEDEQDKVSLLNDLGWNLTCKEHSGRWHLWAGESKLFVGDTEGEFQAFLCGMALSLRVLPDSVKEQIRQIANE